MDDKSDNANGSIPIGIVPIGMQNCRYRTAVIGVPRQRRLQCIATTNLNSSRSTFVGMIDALDRINGRSDNPVRYAIWGPMFSGKSTELLGLYRRLSHANIAFMLAKPARDDRSGRYLVESHDGDTQDAEDFHTAQEIVARAMETDIHVVLIDEAQFFPDLPAALDQLSNLGVHVFMTMLNSTFKGEPWPVVAKILHTCDVRQTYSVCKRCQNCRGMYSKKISKRDADEQDILIGGEDEFEARCRKCFLVDDNDE